MNEEIRTLIAEADRAIREERFDDLMDFYTDDAVLVISPGRLAQGKAAIRAAFVRIAAYFQHSIVPAQGNMVMLAQTLLDADNKEASAYSMERRATYVFRRIDQKWLCAIDNSYGTSLLDEK